MGTTVRTMSPDTGIDTKMLFYALDATEAVVTAYAAWKCGGVRTGMPDFEAALTEGRKLVGKSFVRPEVRRIVLPDGRAFFGFPEKEAS